MLWTVLFANAAVDPISGGAGWVGAGLLGLVLAWFLLKHIPDERTRHDAREREKDEQMAKLIETKDNQIRELINATAERDRERQTEFKAALKEVVDHCERESTRVTESFRVYQTQATATINDLRQLVAMAIREHEEARGKGKAS